MASRMRGVDEAAVKTMTSDERKTDLMEKRMILRQTNLLVYLFSLRWSVSRVEVCHEQELQGSVRRQDRCQ